MLLSGLKRGLQAFNDFIGNDNNKKFLDHPSMANFYPAMRTYAIERQFAIDARKTSSPFIVHKEEFGLFKFKVSFLYMDGVIASIARTYRPGRLPSKSKYKIDFSKATAFDDKNTQMSLFDIHQPGEQPQHQDLAPKPKYCIITYGIYEGKLTHARIVMPRSNYKGYEFNLDIFESISRVNDAIEEETADEDEIAVIKDELENNFLKKGEGK